MRKACGTSDGSEEDCEELGRDSFMEENEPSRERVGKREKFREKQDLQRVKGEQDREVWLFIPTLCELCISHSFLKSMSVESRDGISPSRPVPPPTRERGCKSGIPKRATVETQFT